MLRDDYYVYGYSDSESDDPFFYIGKGCNTRAYDHLEPYNRLKEKSPFHSKLNKMLSEENKPNIDFLGDCLLESEAFYLESALIYQYGRKDLGTGCLLNITDGGEGSSGCLHSLKTKQKMSKIKIGKIKSLETRQRLSNSLAFRAVDETARVNLSNSITTARRTEIGLQAQKHRCIKVCSISPLTGRIIRIFDSGSTARKNGYPHICQVLSGEKKSCGGYWWKYWEEGDEVGKQVREPIEHNLVPA